MTKLRPPPGFKRVQSDLAATNAAETVMRSPLGQRALRECWGHGLFQYVIDWGKPPVQPQTIDALKRAANAYRWELAEMVKTVDRKDPLAVANLSFMESAARIEVDLCSRFLEPEPAHA